MTRWLKSLGVFAGLSILCLGVAFLLLYFLGDGTPEGNQMAIQEVGGTLDIIRWSGITLVVLTWPWFATMMAKQRGWDDKALVVVKRFQWRLLFWLLAIELLIVQGWLAGAMTWMFS